MDAHRWRQIMSIAVALIAAATIASCAKDGKITPDETFSITWLDTQGVIQLRNSSDAASWSPVAFPKSVTSQHGPAINADPTGYMHLVATLDKQAKVAGIFGLGPISYQVAKPVTLAAPNQIKADSGFSLASTDTSHWYFAYRSEGSAKVSLLVRKTKDSVLTNTWSDETPTLGVSNNYVEGNPAIAIRSNDVVVSWYRRPPGGIGELHLVVGTIETAGSINWLGSYVFPISEPGAGGVEAPHDLTSDGKHFFLGTIREDLPAAPPLKTHSLYIYSSSDGKKWSLKTMGGMKNMQKSMHAFPENHLRIAINSKGILLAAQARTNEFRTFRFDGLNWKETSASFAGSYRPKGTQVSVAVTGEP